MAQTCYLVSRKITRMNFKGILTYNGIDTESQSGRIISKRLFNLIKVQHLFMHSAVINCRRSGLAFFIAIIFNIEKF